MCTRRSSAVKRKGEGLARWAEAPLPGSPSWSPDDAPTKDACRHTAYQRMRRYILGHYGTRRNNCPLSNGHALKNCHSHSGPNSVTNRDRCLSGVIINIMKVVIADDKLIAKQAIVTDGYLSCTDNN